MTDDLINELIKRVQPGFSLEQAFYCSSHFFQIDLDQIIRQKWLLADQNSRSRAIGDYFLFKIAQESTITCERRFASLD